MLKFDATIQKINTAIHVYIFIEDLFFSITFTFFPSNIFHVIHMIIINTDTDTVKYILKVGFGINKLSTLNLSKTPQIIVKQYISSICRYIQINVFFILFVESFFGK
jgi:hypothetical protein